MSGRAQLLQRSRQVKRQRQLIQLVGLACLVVIAFVLTVYALHQPRWRIEQVEIIGVKSIDGSNVAELIENETAGSYFWLVPKNSRLFYPEKTLERKVNQIFPRVASLKFDVFGSWLRVMITERESELLWCLLDAANVKSCYFVDVTGIAFARAPTFTNHVLFEVYQKNNPTSTATSSVLGRVVLSPSVLGNIYDQKEAIRLVLTNQKMFDRSIITSVELVPGGGYAFDVVSPGWSDGKWQLLTTAKMSTGSLSKSLMVLLGSGSFDKNVVKERRALSYIDARLASKVFFKVLENHATSTP